MPQVLLQPADAVVDHQPRQRERLADHRGEALHDGAASERGQELVRVREKHPAPVTGRLPVVPRRKSADPMAKS